MYPGNPHTGTSGFSITGAVRIQGRASTSACGADLNADGMSDLLIGAPNADGGSVYLIWGRRANIPASIALETLGNDETLGSCRADAAYMDLCSCP